MLNVNSTIMLRVLTQHYAIRFEIYYTSVTYSFMYLRVEF